MTKTDQDRADFEAWTDAQCSDETRERWMLRRGTSYAHPVTRGAWEAWQAALAHERARAQGEPVAGVDMQFITKRRAEFERGGVVAYAQPAGTYRTPVYTRAAPAAPPAESGEVERKGGLEEVGATALGYTIYREQNGVGGHRYWSDEIGGGVVAWDTCLVAPETLQTCLRIEMGEEHHSDIAAPPPEPAKAEVVVKPLEWSWEPPYSVARALGGHYAVEQWEGARGSFHFDLIGTFLTKHDGFASHDEAKAAAQADYERRILSALATPPTAPLAARSAAEEMRERCAKFAIDARGEFGSVQLAERIMGIPLPGEEA